MQSSFTVGEIVANKVNMIMIVGENCLKNLNNAKQHANSSVCLNFGEPRTMRKQVGKITYETKRFYLLYKKRTQTNRISIQHPETDSTI